MNYTKITAFLALTLGFVWLSIFLANMLNISEMGMIAMSLFHLWAPGFAAIIVQKWVYQEPLSNYGMSRKGFGPKWIVTSVFGPYALVLIVLSIVFLFGNLLNVPGFGFVVFEAELATLSYQIAALIGSIFPNFTHIMMPQEFWILIFILLIGGFLLGPTLGLITSFGEELGWRGLMLEETKSLGFLGSNLIIGLLWALCFIPQVLRTPEISGSELYLSVLAFLGYSVSFSFPLAYMARKSASLFGTAIFRGVFNIISPVTFFFIWGEDPIIGSINGLVGMLIFLSITFIIIRYDPEFVENYANMSYEDVKDQD